MTQKINKQTHATMSATKSKVQTNAFLEKRKGLINLICAEEKSNLETRYNLAKPRMGFLDKRKSVIDSLCIKVNGIVVKPIRPMGPVVSGLRRSSLVEYSPRGPKSGGTMAYTKIVSGFGTNR